VFETTPANLLSMGARLGGEWFHDHDANGKQYHQPALQTYVTSFFGHNKAAHMGGRSRRILQQLYPGPEPPVRPARTEWHRVLSPIRGKTMVL